ncbi:MAG: hypothetical protein ACRDRT_05275 [Pseudonocardiaceae bacterium]
MIFPGMIFFGKFPAGEAQGSADAQSLRRRTTVAVMTFLLAISAVALTPVKNNFSPPSSRLVLACGDTPGACPNLVDAAASTGARDVDV